MSHHGQHLDGLAVLDHRDVAMPPGAWRSRRQQHPAAARAAVGGHQCRLRGHQGHDGGRGDTVATSPRPEGHDLGVGHQRPGQTSAEPVLELIVVLVVALRAVAAIDRRHRHTSVTRAQTPAGPGCCGCGYRGPAGRRTRSADSATTIGSRPPRPQARVSTTTSSTRINRRCKRTCIVLGPNGAS